MTRYRHEQILDAWQAHMSAVGRHSGDDCPICQQTYRALAESAERRQRGTALAWPANDEDARRIALAVKHAIERKGSVK